MYQRKNPELICSIRRAMIFAGFWDKPVSDRFLIQKLFLLYKIFMKTGIMLLWSMLLCELFRLVIYKYDFSTITSAVGIFVNSSKVVVKLIIYTRRDVSKMLEDITEKEIEVWRDGSEEIQEIYRGKIKMLKIYILGLAFSTGLAVVCFYGVGVVVNNQLLDYNRQYNASLETHVIYQTLIPLNKLDHLTTFYITQLYWSWTAVNFNVITHNLMITLLLFTTAQLQILEVRFRNFVGSEDETSLSDEKANQKVVILKQLIRDHQFIIGFVEQVNSWSRIIILMEFTFSSLDLASAMTTLVKMKTFELGPMLFLLLFFGVLSQQILVLGWNCNEITVHSEAVGDGVFNSNWFKLNKEAKQMIPIIIARTQRPLILQIGPFGPMTTTSLLMIYKAAYSYLSVMK